MTPGEGNALELAARRLERAVSQLEQKITAERTARLAAFSAAAAAASSGPASDDPGLFDADAQALAESKAARLALDLEAARAREKALEEAGEQASEALGRAIAEIRAALGDESLITEGVHDDDEDGGDEGADAGDLFGGLDDDDGVTEREA
ncbi:hypothetical protein [Caulobacter sp. UNC279MFTsu5.1]|uniref:DUF4164 family protein n=1 Tax=Caulobacter sp. UNC279MFTsu5.1 TaxID=1502775 RepID=UPI0008E9E00B|nr:hypothetical protein [Caulobacter sp. UNC279MFTsu5.1]SFJ17934.1 hypothetical protein SAMN02799626_01272 [Caulobacter sp. UNC279MFTsu5.1]